MLVQMFAALKFRRRSNSAQAWLASTRSFLARHVMEASMLLCVTGWSLMWANALSLVKVVPIWIAISCFYAGLVIPGLRSGSRVRSILMSRGLVATHRTGRHLARLGRGLLDYCVGQ